MVELKFVLAGFLFLTNSAPPPSLFLFLVKIEFIKKKAFNIKYKKIHFKKKKQKFTKKRDEEKKGGGEEGMRMQTWGKLEGYNFPMNMWSGGNINLYWGEGEIGGIQFPMNR